jgi:transcriptional regulator with XRE-family HTH domain
MLNEKLKRIIEIGKQSHVFWAERLKLDFATQLNKRRKSRGMTLAELAQQLQTTPAYISKVFRGDTNLTIESMARLAKATGGKIDIKIIDENMISDPQVWIGKITPRGNNHAYSVQTPAQTDLIDDIREKKAA